MSFIRCVWINVDIGELRVFVSRFSRRCVCCTICNVQKFEKSEKRG